MCPAVKIADLTDALVMVSPESTAWLDRDTGRVYVIKDHAMAIAEGDAPEDADDSLADYDEVELAQARELCSRPDRALELPTPFDFHEYRHMERFISTLPESDATRQLERAIRGRGAFRRFKDTAYRLGVIDAWYAYRDAAARKLMRDWAAINKVPVDETSGTRLESSSDL